jgi:hypothetical protein
MEGIQILIIHTNEQQGKKSPRSTHSRGQLNFNHTHERTTRKKNHLDLHIQGDNCGTWSYCTGAVDWLMKLRRGKHAQGKIGKWNALVDLMCTLVKISNTNKLKKLNEYNLNW